MNIFKPNTETTLLDRLRVMIGVLIAFGGIWLTVLNFITNSLDDGAWIMGVGLFVVGVLVAVSNKITAFFTELF